MYNVHMDMIQTAGLGALALVLGWWLTEKVGFLRKYCVPAPVSGGILFSVISLALYSWGGIELSFDGTLKDAFMLAFFTSVGFQGDLRMLKSGGRPLLVMLGLIVILVAIQNLVSLGLARMMGVDSLVGMAAGSISMTGGHGTAGGFTPLLEEMGLQGAGTVAMAAATFGLIAGSMLGGPLADMLVRRKVNGGKGMTNWAEADSSRTEIKDSFGGEVIEYAKAACWIVIVMGAGSLVSRLLQSTGITFPTYFGALILAVAVRNVFGISGKIAPNMPVGRIVGLGEICLGLFLGMAMISLRLWELASLALPLCIILGAQVAIMALFGYFIAFRALGKNYDAAVMVAGLCGFGLGATPNAMANMGAVCGKYRYSVQAFLIIPIVGAMFTDLINTGAITLFLNWIK